MNKSDTNLKAINKLLEISSEQIEDADYEVSKEWLEEIYRHKNGFYAFESALHFFSSCELKMINNLISAKNYYDEDCLFFWRGYIWQSFL